MPDVDVKLDIRHFFAAELVRTSAVSQLLKLLLFAYCLVPSIIHL